MPTLSTLCACEKTRLMLVETAQIVRGRVSIGKLVNIRGTARSMQQCKKTLQFN